MNLDNLTDDQLEDIELPDEALDEVAGGINPTAAIYQFVKRYLSKRSGS